MRKRSLAALCTATALGIVLAIPTAATAADPHASGFRAWTDRTRVYLDFGTGPLPKGLKVHLRKAGTDTPAATVTSFEPRKDDTPCIPSCQQDPGVTGVQSAPLRLADLGRYTVDVEYKGTLGEPVRYKDKATLAYDLIPRVTALEVVGKPHLDNRTVTIKADAVGRDPRNDTDQPLANGKMMVETNAVTAPLVTDAAGHIEAPFTFAGSEQIMATGLREVIVTLRPENEPVGSELGQLVQVGTLTPPKSKITLDAAKLRGPDGSKVPASGRLTFQSADGTWKPAPAGTWLRGRNGGWAKTVENGRFTVDVPVSGRLTALVDHKESGWLSSTYATVAVDPSTSATMHGDPSPRIGGDEKFTVSGKLYAYDIPAPIKLKVVVEFRRLDTEAWVVQATRESAAPAGDSTRVVTVAGLPYPGAGHWRMRYTGTPAIPAGPAVTSTLHYWYKTAIPEFNAAPEPVKAGRPITVTGKLTYQGIRGGPFTGLVAHPVRVYFRATGTTTWKLMGTATTAWDGTFKKAFTAAKDGTWQARYEPGLEVCFASKSREDLVDVQ